MFSPYPIFLESTEATDPTVVYHISSASLHLLDDSNTTPSNVFVVKGFKI